MKNLSIMDNVSEEITIEGKHSFWGTDYPAYLSSVNLSQCWAMVYKNSERTLKAICPFIHFKLGIRRVSS